VVSIKPDSTVDQLLCTTSVVQTMASYSWRDLVTNDVIGNEERLDLSSLCNTTVDHVDSGNSLEIMSLQCTASIHHGLNETVTASSNSSFNVSIIDYCNNNITTLG